MVARVADNSYAHMLLTSFNWSFSKLESTIVPFSRGEDHYITNYFVKFLQSSAYFLALAASSILAIPGLTMRAIKPYIDPIHRFDNIDWTRERVDNLVFSRDMKFGVATADYQVNGAGNFPHCTWADYENKHNLPVEQRSGMALDDWHHMDDVIARLKILGVNSYRFSVERCAIEPERGVFSSEAIEHYVEFCRKLKETGIEPIVTMHHFNNPSWFDELGGFEREENIAEFTQYCVEIYRALSPYVQYWATFNEPNLYAFTGYVMGQHPPEKAGDFKTAAIVLENMFKAHVEIYRAIKEIDGSHNSKIGIVHDVLRTVAYHSWNPIELAAAHYMTRITHDVFMKFFKEGVFEYQMPFFANEKYVDATAPQTLDWLGVNYYSDPLLSEELSRKFLVSTCFPNQEMTDLTYPGQGNAYRNYPQGLYSAIAECSELGKEMLVTENGIVAEDDEKRAEFYRRALYMVSKAQQDGYNVKGYCPWTLSDNYEWTVGWTPGGRASVGGFGLFAFNKETKEHTLRPSSKVYIDAIAGWRQTVGA